MHEPDHGVTAGISPENVCFAVTVEVAMGDDRPCSRNGAETTKRRSGPTLHQPQRNIAARVAPKDVAFAVAIGVMGILEAVAGKQNAPSLSGVHFDEPN